MATILHIDSSARSGESGKQKHGSHTRRLTKRFLDRWLASAPGTKVISRDVAAMPPTPVDGRWIEAAFTRPESRSKSMQYVLMESDLLVDELQQADLILIGAPMYNFGVPSTLKAWIDNVVRVGRTFGFDRSREGAPYWPMLQPGKQLVILSARGDGGYGPGNRLSSSNLVEASLKVPMAYIGISDVHSVAVEWDEFADERVIVSMASAEAEIDSLVDRLTDLRATLAA
jgi:FMN-dependent NADH-azoreductase